MKAQIVAKSIAAVFLGIGVVGASLVRAENRSNCDAHRGETFCSTFNVARMLADNIVNGEDASGSILGLISVAEKAQNDIRYFTTFNLIRALVEIEESFEQTEDYQRLKRAFVQQLLQYSALSGDAIRPNLYLAYLDTIIEPKLDLPKSANYPPIDWSEPSESAKLHIKCMVESDVPFLPFQNITESAEFVACMIE
ncbi:hypothetical protein AB1A64_13080 [Ruegeria sp. ANG10]|uniref:hypothetical protein n=1 Tax=Ruegeria sp. ANG10 TaxID=3042467 RepID=UPI003455697D